MAEEMGSKVLPEPTRAGHWCGRPPVGWWGASNTGPFLGLLCAPHHHGRTPCPRRATLRRCYVRAKRNGDVTADLLLGSDVMGCHSKPVWLWEKTEVRTGFEVDGFDDERLCFFHWRWRGRRVVIRGVHGWWRGTLCCDWLRRARLLSSLWDRTVIAEII